MRWIYTLVFFTLSNSSILHSQERLFERTAKSVQLPHSGPIELKNVNPDTMISRPALVSIYIGISFSEAYQNEKNDSFNSGIENQIFRKSELIYTNSNSGFNRTKAFALESLIRLEYEKPLNFEKLWLLKNIKSLRSLEGFSAHFSIGGMLQANRALNSTAQSDMRYINPQAPNAALIDMTYQGTLSAIESRSTLLPMIGLGYAFALDRQKQWKIFTKSSVGAALLSGERVAKLLTDAKYVSAGIYSENYSISAEYRQHWQMSLAFAAQLDLGVRIEVFQGHHISILGSLLMLTGKLSMEQSGYFREQAGDRVTFQKNITGTIEERVFQWFPLASIAYSMEY